MEEGLDLTISKNLDLICLLKTLKADSSIANKICSYEGIYTSY